MLRSIHSYCAKTLLLEGDHASCSAIYSQRSGDISLTPGLLVLFEYLTVDTML